MEWHILDKNNFDEYNNFIRQNHNNSIWHFPCWLDFQVKSNKADSGFIFCIKENNEIILAGVYLIYKTSLKIQYGYIPGGFLYNKISDEIYFFLLKNLKKTAKKLKIIHTQIDSTTKYDPDLYNIIKKQKNHKFNVKLPITNFTRIIDLNLSEDEILKNMKQDGRYSIRQALKKDVIIKHADKNEIGIFYDILTETAKRDEFSLNPLKYYENMLNIVPGTMLLIAYSQDIPIAAGIFIFSNSRTLYYYGASSGQYRKLMAPYLLVWEALKIAKQKNSRIFDLMGISPPGSKNDRLAGVSVFKSKFGGEIVQFNPSYHIVHISFIYNIFYFAKKILKKS